MFCAWLSVEGTSKSFGAPSTIHDRFQEWRQAGVFDRLWQAGVEEYHGVKGINWEWQAMDGIMTKAPLGGEATGPNPTDRGKSRTKRSSLTSRALWLRGEDSLPRSPLYDSLILYYLSFHLFAPHPHCF